MKKLFSFLILLISIQVFCMQIFVKVSEAKTIALEVEANDTIENLKSKIQDKEEYLTPDSYDLYFGDEILSEGRTLADYNVPKESLLEVVLKSSLSTMDFSKNVDVLFSNFKKSLVFKEKINQQGSVFIYDLTGQLLEQIKLNQQELEYPIKTKGTLIASIVLENKKTKNIKIINH